MTKANDLNLWNLKIIDPPPFVTLNYTQNEFNDLFKSTNFRFLFKSSLEKLQLLLETGQHFFLSEKQILEKLIFKNWNSLRKEKSLQYMKKLKRLLNDYVNLKFNYLIETINILSRSLDKSEIHRPRISLPSREVFEYLLTRLYTVLNIFDHIIFLIRNKICFYIIKNIKNGIFLSNNLLYLSNIARIYSIIKKYQINSKFLYNSLRENISFIKPTSIKWNESFIIEDLPFFINEQRTNLDEILEKNTTNFENITSVNFISSFQDIGEVIERDPIEQKLKPKCKKKKKNSSSNKRNILFKKIRLFVTTFDQIDEIKLKFKRFIKSKLKKLGSNYSSFLKDCLNDKKIFIKKLNQLLENVSKTNLSKKTLIRKSIIQIIRKLIK